MNHLIYMPAKVYSKHGKQQSPISGFGVQLALGVAAGVVLHPRELPEAGLRFISHKCGKLPQLLQTQHPRQEPFGPYFSHSLCLYRSTCYSGCQDLG